MDVWDKWGGKAEDVVSSEEDEDVRSADAGANVVKDPEVWMDYWSEELVTLWHGLLEQKGALGAGGVLDAADFPAFAQFCWEHSSGRPPPV